MAGWDCHAHVFGPYDRFPLAPDRSYTPPEAPIENYLAMLERLALSRGVLVHPSAYGEDYSLLRNVLARQPNLRGVIVTRDSPRNDACAICASKAFVRRASVTARGPAQISQAARRSRTSFA